LYAPEFIGGITIHVSPDYDEQSDDANKSQWVYVDDEVFFFFFFVWLEKDTL
jgi:hypothetical protein